MLKGNAGSLNKTYEVAFPKYTVGYVLYIVTITYIVI